MNRDLGTRIKESVSPGTTNDLVAIVRRSRALQRRRIVSAVSALGLLAAAAALFPRVIDQWPPAPAEAVPAGPVTEPPPTQDDNSFHPVIYEEGGMRVMPVTFLDGTFVEMLYPADFPFETLDVISRGDVILDHHDFILRRDDSSTARGSVVFTWRGDGHGGAPAAVEAGPHGQWVTRWNPVPTPRYGDAFGLGSWVVVFDNEVDQGPLAAADAAAIRRHLWGLQTEAGFLALGSNGPLELWPGDEGPPLLELAIGPDITLLSDCMRGSGELQRVGDREVYVHEDGSSTWCDRPDGVTVQVADPKLAERLSRDLRFRNYDRVSDTGP